MEFWAHYQYILPWRPDQSMGHFLTYPIEQQKRPKPIAKFQAAKFTKTPTPIFILFY